MKKANEFSKSILAIISVFAIMATTARGAMVWNVNVGDTVNTTDQITTTDNYVGAATENTANSVWNGITSSVMATLADSAGNTSTGVTFTITPAAGSGINFSSTPNTAGAEIFKSWIKDGGANGGNNDPYEVTFGGLTVGAGATYSLVVYSGWFFGPDNVPVSQTAGSGLLGTFNLNSLDMNPGNPLATGLAPDTNAADTPGNFNYARFDGLTADGSGNLTFRFGGPRGVDAPINGFQLVLVPEPPAAAVLGGLGLIVLLGRRHFC